MSRKNIFDQLIEKKIPFAVLQSFVLFKNPAIPGMSKDYCIIIDAADLPKMGNKKFRASDYKYDMPRKTFERNMSAKEIDIFISMFDMFVTAHSCEHGRAYEYAQMPFKEYYKKLNK